MNGRRPPWAIVVGHKHHPPSSMVDDDKLWEIFRDEPCRPHDDNTSNHLKINSATRTHFKWYKQTKNDVTCWIRARLLVHATSLD